jgi:hypothetical protein
VGQRVAAIKPFSSSRTVPSAQSRIMMGKKILFAAGQKIVL